MKKIKYLLLSLLMMAGLVAQAQQVDLSEKSNAQNARSSTRMSKSMSRVSTSLINTSLQVLDALYGPWSSFKEIAETLTGEEELSEEDVEYFMTEEIPAGITVAIVEDGKVVEYWNPVVGEGFVKKQADIEQLKQELLELINKKRDGYFSVTPVISGDPLTTDVLTACATANNSQPITYTWYAANTLDDANNEKGTELSTGATYTITKDDYGKYLYAIASFEDNPEYNGISKSTTPVKVIKNFCFSTDVLTKCYGVDSPEFSLQTNSDDVTYSIVSGNEEGVIEDLDEGTGDIILNDNHKLGTVRIKATLNDGELGKYTNSEAYIDIVVNKPIVSYIGMNDKYIIANNVDADGLFTLPTVNMITTTSNNIYMNPSEIVVDGTNRIMRFSNVTKNSWYFIVPRSKEVISIIENGGTNLTNDFKRDGTLNSDGSVNTRRTLITFTDEFGDSDFDVYLCSASAALQGGWTLNFTLK